MRQISELLAKLVLANAKKAGNEASQGWSHQAKEPRELQKLLK